MQNFRTPFFDVSSDSDSKSLKEFQQNYKTKKKEPGRLRLRLVKSSNPVFVQSEYIKSHTALIHDSATGEPVPDQDLEGYSEVEIEFKDPLRDLITRLASTQIDEQKPEQEKNKNCSGEKEVVSSPDDEIVQAHMINPTPSDRQDQAKEESFPSMVAEVGLPKTPPQSEYAKPRWLAQEFFEGKENVEERVSTPKLGPSGSDIDQNNKSPAHSPKEQFPHSYFGVDDLLKNSNGERYPAWDRTISKVETGIQAKNKNATLQDRGISQRSRDGEVNSRLPPTRSAFSGFKAIPSNPRHLPRASGSAIPGGFHEHGYRRAHSLPRGNKHQYRAHDEMSEVQRGKQPEERPSLPMQRSSPQMRGHQVPLPPTYTQAQLERLPRYNSAVRMRNREQFLQQHGFTQQSRAARYGGHLPSGSFSAAGLPGNSSVQHTSTPRPIRCQNPIRVLSPRDPDAQEDIDKKPKDSRIRRFFKH